MAERDILQLGRITEDVRTYGNERIVDITTGLIQHYFRHKKQSQNLALSQRQRESATIFAQATLNHLELIQKQTVTDHGHYEDENYQEEIEWMG